MQFDITIQHNSTRYHFSVEQGKASKGFELFTLTAGDRKVVLQSNRPMLVAKGLKHKPIYWKVVEGEVRDNKALERVIKEIEHYLKEQTVIKDGQGKMDKESAVLPPLTKTRKRSQSVSPAIPWSEQFKTKKG